MNIAGSLDANGVTLTNPTAVWNIVLALRTSTTYGSMTYNGRLWAVGVCGSGNELSANGAVCVCTSGYAVRPCTGGASWGGINGVTCNAATQTITVTFYY